MNQKEINFDLLFSQGNAKVNKLIKLTPEDKKSKVKVFCQEPYAQDLYEFYFNSGRPLPTSIKDIPIGEVRTVKIKSIDYNLSLIHTEDIETFSSIFVPFREFSHEPNLALLNEDNAAKYKVMVYRSDNGEIYASEKKCAALTLKEDIDYFTQNNKWFYVKVVELIKGGYLALYKNQIKCFLPGSHAAANVIRDFSEYLHKEIPVMVENFDSVNNLYIVSYKKYIKETLPQRISELSFTQKYTGTLTNNPYDFGVFVEFQNYYTGLIHKSDFIREDGSGEDKFREFVKNLRAGDKVDFWVKDITQKKGEYRIILTIDPERIDPIRKSWQALKEQIETQILPYDYDRGSMSIELPNNQSISVSVSPNIMKGRPSTGRVLIEQVDVLRQNLGFDILDD